MPLEPAVLLCPGSGAATRVVGVRTSSTWSLTSCRPRFCPICLRGQQPHDEPSHLGKHSTPGCGIEVWSHPRRRRGRPTPAGRRTTGPGAALAIDSRSWGPPVACPAVLPHGAVGPGRLLHQHTGHPARGTHRPRGRRDPAGRAQPALPGGHPRRVGRGPHRPQHPHPQTRPARPARRLQPPAVQRR